MTTRTVIFDMDGTLVQSRGGAWAVFQDTVAAFDLPMEGPEQFFDLFRENFFVALRAFVGEPARAEAVAEHFLKALRERYTPELIPGIADVVHTLAGHFSMAVISSNAMGAIRRTLDHSGVAACFAHVFSGDIESDKSASIRRILADPSYTTVRRCGPSYLEEAQAQPSRASASEVVLVTDTVGDVREGVSCGIRVFGVSWGMHSAADLLAAGAELVVLWPQELVAHLLPDGSCEPGGCACLSCAVSQPVARPQRDVRAEARVAGALRAARRVGPAPAQSATACGCDDQSGCTAPRTGDPYLALALSMISAQPP